MRPVVFAGPSIHGVDRALTDGFDLHPPAVCGDILAAVLSGVRVIGLIDGIFETALAAWHKEILYALTQGASVFGASSMGALRAAECAAFGMIGVGTIFADYASGARVADADVAVAHAPAALDFQPLTVALVDVEATIRAMAQAGLDPGHGDRLISAARVLHFKDRTWADVIARAGFSGPEAAAIHAGVERWRQNVKRRDAEELLSRLRGLPHEPEPAAPSWHLARTGYFAALEKRVRSAQIGATR